MFKSSAPFPNDKATATVYAREMAQGLKVWIWIDVVIFISILLANLNLREKYIMSISVMAVICALSCPMIMVLGYLHGCLKFMTIKECLVVVKKTFE